MDNLIFTERTPELLNLMVSLFGKSVYDTFEPEDVIVFNLNTFLWYTQYKIRISALGSHLTSEQFIYIIDLYQMGIILTKAQVLNIMNQ